MIAMLSPLHPSLSQDSDLPELDRRGLDYSSTDALQ
jgi:hypothetical protein